MTAQFVMLLDELRRRSLRLASLVEDMLDEASDAAFDANVGLALRVIERETEVDAARVTVEEEVVRLLALYQPVGRDLRFLCIVLKVNAHLEGIAGCAVNIAERARHQVVQNLTRNQNDLKQLAPAVRNMLRRTIHCYGEEDEPLARRVMAEDSAIDALYAQIVRDTVATADRSLEALAAHLDLLSVAKNLERIADHAVGIAREVVFVTTGELLRRTSTT